jgi:hypothetical protein
MQLAKRVVERGAVNGLRRESKWVQYDRSAIILINRVMKHQALRTVTEAINIIQRPDFIPEEFFKQPPVKRVATVHPLDVVTERERKFESKPILVDSDKVVFDMKTFPQLHKLAAGMLMSEDDSIESKVLIREIAKESLLAVYVTQWKNARFHQLEGILRGMTDDEIELLAEQDEDIKEEYGLGKTDFEYIVECISTELNSRT